MAIPQAQPSSKNKNNKALQPKKKIFKNRDGDGLHAGKQKKVVSLDLDKRIVSYQPKAEGSRSQGFDPKQSSPMDRALEIQANLASKFPSFVKKMLPSHVAGGFWLGLPKKFTEMHLPKQNATVVLVDETELEHETKYLTEKNGLSGGWRGFSIAHKLQEKDVLVFHLIQERKFKVYIVRANALSEVDGAIDLLNLGACSRKTDSDHHEEGLELTALAPEEHPKQYSPVHSAQERDVAALSNSVDAGADNSRMDIDNSGAEDFHGIRTAQSVHSAQERDVAALALSNSVDAGADNSRMDIDNSGAEDFHGIRTAQSVHSTQERDVAALSNTVDAGADNSRIDIDNSGAEDFHGIRIAQSVLDINDVKRFEDFSITVDGIILDSHMPDDLRIKYYELCRTQKSYLHDQLIDELSLQLVLGVIAETVSIADAISSSKPSSYEDLKAWDKTLKSFEILGMKVGFLRAKIDKLLTLSSDSEDALKRKIIEKTKAEEKLKALEIKRSSLKEVIENLAHEIEAMKIKAEEP